LIHPGRKPKVFMMDLWAIVPYYTAYLSRALLQQGVDLMVGSIDYYLDPECFRSRDLTLDPGLLNVVGRFQIPKLPRRVLKLIESTLNLCALGVRFTASPPDIVHVQFLAMLRWRIPLDLWLVRFLRRRGTNIVLTVHDILPHDTGERHKRIYSNFYGEVDAIICHSDHIAERLQRDFNVPTSKIDVIPHGPFFYDLPTPGAKDILRNFGLNNPNPLVLFQGLIFPYKGVDLLVDAWQLVESEMDEPHLIIAGTGSPELLDQLREQIQTLGLRRVHLQFRFISTEELVTLYRAADIVVYPYRAVTTSGALATGLALGKTIVASDLYVFRELLVNGKSALLIDPCDKKQFASALIRLSKDRQLRADLSSEVENLQFGDQSWEAIALKTIQTYDKVLSNYAKSST
jgi:glycosyltransferase involved in cell wall biosynthesis